MIRVLLVDDSPLALQVLKKILSNDLEIMVIGTAENGQQGIDEAIKLKPDVICTDFHMPIMDGLEFTEQVMEICPTPILIISVAVQAEHQDNVFRLLDAGAVDILPKPYIESGFDDPTLGQELIRKIKILSGVSVFRRKKTIIEYEAPISTIPSPNFSTSNKQVLVIGASTGGPQAFEAILSKLPTNYSLPIICVQHISTGFLSSFITWLNSTCQLNVSIATAGEKPAVGHVYFAPDDANLLIDAQGCMQLSTEGNYFHFPSVDATLNSVASYYGNKTAGVLLTGMGDDGAKGLKAIAEAGGMTIAQDEASSTVFGMPKVAIEMGAAQKVLSLEQITQTLCAMS